MSPNRWAEAQSIEKAGDIDERHEQVNRSGYSGDCFDCVTRPEQCAPVGDGRRFSTLSQAKSPRRKAESLTLPLPGTERIRHQTGCGRHQTPAVWNAPAAQARGSGIWVGDRRSGSGVLGRSDGDAECSDHDFYPDTGTTHPTMSPEHPYSRGRGASRARAARLPSTASGSVRAGGSSGQVGAGSRSRCASTVGTGPAIDRAQATRKYRNFRTGASARLHGPAVLALRCAAVGVQ